MASENPFAYHETRDVAYQNETDFEGRSETEPRTPIALSLKHHRYIFFAKLCEMTVFQNHLVVEGPHLQEPIHLERETASQVVRFKMTRLVLRVPDRGKYKFSYAKDPEKELKIARLDTWSKTAIEDASAYNDVELNLKKHCCWITWSNTFALSFFFGIILACFILALIAVFVNSINGGGAGTIEVAVFGTLALMFFTFFIVNAAIAVLLAYRQTWALTFAIVAYSIATGFALILVLVFILLPIIPFAVALIVLIQAIIAKRALHRQLRQLQIDNRGDVIAASVAE